MEENQGRGGPDSIDVDPEELWVISPQALHSSSEFGDDKFVIAVPKDEYDDEEDFDLCTEWVLRKSDLRPVRPTVGARSQSQASEASRPGSVPTSEPPRPLAEWTPLVEGPSSPQPQEDHYPF